MRIEEREQQASEELAERLDALSRPLAERVLGRAIELDGEARRRAEAAADTIGYDDLKEIAAEVGISEPALKRALMEELNTERDHAARPMEKATAPDTVRGGLIVPGTIEEVVERLRRHLEAVQGMERRGGRGTHDVWRARRPRPPDRVDTWTVTQGSGREQLVEIDVATARARRVAWRWFVGLLVIGTLFGNAIGAFVGLGLIALGVATVVGWAKRFVAKARRSINRALAALVEHDAGDRDPPSWIDLWTRSRQ